MSAAYAKPLPHARRVSRRSSTAGARQRELRFQRCATCRAWRHVPREMCAECGSPEWRWERVERPRARLHLDRRRRARCTPRSRRTPPYAPVVVEMDEGVRLVSEVVDCPPDELAIGMPVEVVFDDVTDEVTLPKFRRLG